MKTHGTINYVGDKGEGESSVKCALRIKVGKLQQNASAFEARMESTSFRPSD